MRLTRWWLACGIGSGSSDLRFLDFRPPSRRVRLRLSGFETGIARACARDPSRRKENGIRTCVVCPGLVETEFLEKRPVKPNAETLAKAMQPDDVAEIILSIAKLPPRAAVPELQIMPTYL